jgi:hypothetical protein
MGHVHRYGETYALPLRYYSRIYANDLALEVKERPSAVARIERRVGLYEIVVCAEPEGPSLGADYAGRDGVSEPERVTYSYDPVAYPEVLGISVFDRLQLAIGFEFYDGEVRFRIPADYFRFVLIAVFEYDAYVRGLFDYVVIGDNVTVLADYEPRAETLALELFLRLPLEESIEKFLEWVVGAEG